MGPTKFAYIAGAVLTGATVVCSGCLDGSGAALEAGTAASVPAPESSVEAIVADTARATLAITGMTCGSCATTARIALERSEGVYGAEVSYDSASAVVTYDSETTVPLRFIAQLKELTGYEAVVVPETSKDEAL